MKSVINPRPKPRHVVHISTCLVIPLFPPTTNTPRPLHPHILPHLNASSHTPHPHLQTMPPPIPPTFTTLKTRLLQSLSVPTSSYTDASPKGTLDTAIVPLIGRLNDLEGVVSTSSCAGRVSVFLEGWKGGGGMAGERSGEGVGRKKNGEGVGRKKNSEGVGMKGDGGYSGDSGDRNEEERAKRKGVISDGKGGERIVPGGKGMGGRWLFVSHERVEMPQDHDTRGSDAMGKECNGHLTKLFGLTGQASPECNEDGGARRSSYTKNTRFVRFAFEPMILHIATASLSHAAPILSAAISAGFRESGVQSLKNLSDPNAIPMVA
ncbi:MAG: hypothetical protein Q9192_008200, partial [Flavoplaca navasiana]